MDAQTLRIIILAGLAVVVFVRFLNVLGTREGYEETPEPAKNTKILENQHPVAQDFADEMEDYVPNHADIRQVLTRAHEIDPKFRVPEFLEGAKKAYEWILISFLNGTIEEIRPYVDTPVFEGFDQALNERTEKGERVVAHFGGVKQIDLVGASLDEATRTLTLSIKIRADLSKLHYDAQDNLIEGVKNKFTEIVNVWRFSRVLGADNPNWILVATR